MLDRAARLILDTAALRTRSPSDRGSTRLEHRPLVLAVYEYPPITQQLIHHRWAALDIRKRDDLQRPAQMRLQATAQPLETKRIATTKCDNQVEIGLRLLLATGKGPEDHRQPDIGLGAQELPQRAELAPMEPDVLGLLGREHQRAGAS